MRLSGLICCLKVHFKKKMRLADISQFLVALILFVHFFSDPACTPEINTFPEYNFLSKLLFIANVSDLVVLLTARSCH